MGSGRALDIKGEKRTTRGREEYVTIRGTGNNALSGGK
jgi:hypothetical protein